MRAWKANTKRSGGARTNASTSRQCGGGALSGRAVAEDETGEQAVKAVLVKTTIDADPNFPGATRPTPL